MVAPNERELAQLARLPEGSDQGELVLLLAYLTSDPRGARSFQLRDIGLADVQHIPTIETLLARLKLREAEQAAAARMKGPNTP